MRHPRELPLGCLSFLAILLLALASGAVASWPTIQSYPTISTSPVVATVAPTYTMTTTISDGDGYDDIVDIRILFNFKESAQAFFEGVESTLIPTGIVLRDVITS